MALVIDRVAVIRELPKEDNTYHYTTVIFLKRNLLFNKMLRCTFSAQQGNLTPHEIRERLEKGTIAKNSDVLNSIRMGFAFVENQYLKTVMIENLHPSFRDQYIAEGLL